MNSRQSHSFYRAWPAGRLTPSLLVVRHAPQSVRPERHLSPRSHEVVLPSHDLGRTTTNLLPILGVARRGALNARSCLLFLPTAQLPVAMRQDFHQHPDSRVLVLLVGQAVGTKNSSTHLSPASYQTRRPQVRQRESSKQRMTAYARVAPPKIEYVCTLVALQEPSRSQKCQCSLQVPTPVPALQSVGFDAVVAAPCRYISNTLLKHTWMTLFGGRVPCLPRVDTIGSPSIPRNLLATNKRTCILFTH